MKKFFNYMLAAVCSMTLMACSNDEPNGNIPDQPTNEETTENNPDEPTNEETTENNPDQPTVAEGVFVLNQGNYGKQIEGSLTLIDYETNKAYQNLFQTANGMSLGSTPQTALVYGSKIYIGVYQSNVIQVIDRLTYKVEKMISLENEEGQSPRSMVAKDGKVYIAMFNGYVSRLDTETLTIDKTVKVGPNPEIMAIKGKYLYVPNSDGMNWKEGYGTTASKIDLDNFEVEKTFEVGLNPAEFVCNGNDLFLLCKGNYGDVPSQIYRIDDNDKSTLVAEATLISIKDNNLYYINAPYGVPEVGYSVYDIANGTTSKMIADEGVESPAGLAVDPFSGNIVITSYSKDNGKTSYTTAGYAKVYDSTGAFKNRYEVGVGPCVIFFNYK